MKAELLRTTHGHRVITVATATPIANSVTEAHVMQRYLRPDLLRDAGTWPERLEVCPRGDPARSTP